MDSQLFEELFFKFIREMKAKFNDNYQKKLSGIIGGSIIRGTSPSMAHALEDNFTEFLFQLYREKDYLYLVDVNFSLKIDGARSISYRPDIIVVEKKSNTIKAVFELKIDDARANDEWVEEAINKLNVLKAISENQDKVRNFIQYKTVRVDELGEPITNRAGNIQHDEHRLSCSKDAKVACIALCKENSRKKPDNVTYRTTGTFALYISDKHFNNQKHTLDDLLNSSNLNTAELKKLIIAMNL